MQQVLIVVLIAAAFIGVLFLAGGFEQATTPAPATSTVDSPETDMATTSETTTTRQPTQPTTAERTTTTRATRTTGNAVRLEIGRVVTWNGSPVQIPVWVQGNPQELEFVIRFPNHLARVLSVSSSANWNTDVVRLNEEGEIRVHAVRKTPIGGNKERLLTMKFHRIDAGTASITIPVDELEARFALDEPYNVRVDSGLLTAPF